MSLPLQGKSVLVTRPQHQAKEMADPLEALGANVLLMPTIAIAPTEDLPRLDDALRNLDRYDWIVLTSVNGVEAVRQRMEDLAIPFGSLTRAKLAAIGPATARAMETVFRQPDLVPEEYVSEAIAEGLGGVAGQRFLLARADLARRDLAEILFARGAAVEEVCAYRIVRASNEIPGDEVPDYITLTSSEAARATYDALQQADKSHWFGKSAIVCIGPITAATVRDLGYEPAAVASEYTIPGLIDAIVGHAQELAHV